MMTIDIHDVGHGACVLVTFPNGRRFMLDCGIGHDAGFYPGVHYAGSTIDGLVFTNLDEDHIDGLPGLLATTKINALYSNPTVDAQALACMKARDGMRAGVTKAHELLAANGPGFVGLPFDVGPQCFTRAYFNIFGKPFTDTNNLSLAVFVRYGAFKMLFTGDLEKAGWLKLLEIPAFRDELRGVSLMMASHHGRQNGCCADAFNYMSPGAVIFSDKVKQHDTQETDGWYRSRVLGIDNYDAPLWGGGYQKRRVITTRRDGTLRIEAHAPGGYFIRTTRSEPRLMPPAPLARLFAA